jgi:hypothetical protein
MPSVILLGTAQILLVLIVLCTSTAPGGEPEWVGKRPVSEEFYVGIGMAQKNRPAAEYTEGARNIALNDIASQITVSISSDVLRKVLEKNEHLEEEFQSRIRASATADLEGVQLVDTYETDEGYWVYCRLSRADYAARRAGKLNAATAQSLDLYSRGRKDERAGRVGQALGLYAQAFGPIEKYLAEPLMVESEGRPVYLVSELYNALRTLLDRMEIRTGGGELDAKIGRPLKKPLELVAVLRDSVSLPATHVPFRFTFTRGSGECVDLVRTDEQGIARCEVQKITASDRIQMVEARLDLQALAGGEQTSAVVRTVLGSFTLPETRFVLSVSGVEVFLDADEAMFGKPLQEKRIEPRLKAELGARNFTLVDKRSRASLVISVKADVRKGSEGFGLAFVFASATVSVLDLESGREIFHSSIDDVKEGSDSFEKAAFKSLHTLAGRIAAELVPQLVEKVQK